ncbi:MAG: PD-(D/E)XK motif protein [Alphaproteobacteria bacterium]|nr:PD-(D/E)XK motif protein [Alphaproteobacteria bacterium]
MMQNDLEQLYQILTSEIKGTQKKISVESCINVYLGMSSDGFIGISFMSSIPAPKLNSTKLIRIIQGKESDNTYWTSFDLLQDDIKTVFFTFCQDIIKSISNIYDEQIALNTIKKRYVTWKSLFIKANSYQTPREVVQGLYGELYFLKNYMLKKHDIRTSISSWSGPDSTNKDFSLKDKWYEIKTIGSNSQLIHISSLAQLSSSIDGRLVIIKIEDMSDEFKNDDSNISNILTYIISNITDEDLEEQFLNKIASFCLQDECINKNFDVKSMDLYIVDDKFPRLTEQNITYKEISDVKYSILINTLEKYKEQL